MKTLRLSGIFFFPLILTFMAGSPLYAAAIDPFYSRNQSPFVQIYGLPVAESGFITKHEQLKAVLITDVSNSFSRTTQGVERIHIDGETSRFTALLRYGLFDGFELGIDIPVVGHGGGFTDSLIGSFHKMFGFSSAGRNLEANNQINYLYAVNGVNRVSVQQSTGGLGDVMLSGAYRIWQNQDSRSLALRAGVKVPTGNTGKLLGSGGTDISLRLAYSDAKTFAAQHVTVFGSLGALFLGSGKIMTNEQRQFVSFGTLGLGWQACERVSLKVQFDAHTPFYNSNLDELGLISIQVVMGGSITLFGNIWLDLAVSEDVIVYTAPDIAFHLALRTAF